jgi:hypothetical protein
MHVLVYFNFVCYRYESVSCKVQKRFSPCWVNLELQTNKMFIKFIEDGGDDITCETPFGNCTGILSSTVSSKKEESVLLGIK